MTAKKSSTRAKRAVSRSGEQPGRAGSAPADVELNAGSRSPAEVRKRIGEKITANAEQIVEALIEMARNGNYQAAKYLMEEVAAMISVAEQEDGIRSIAELLFPETASANNNLQPAHGEEESQSLRIHPNPSGK